MKPARRPPFGAQLKAFREAAGFSQKELAMIAGLSVHAVSALERRERRRPHVETVRAGSGDGGRGMSGAWLPMPPTVLLGREPDMQALAQAASPLDP